nr:LCP family protein [Mediterraneibacter glycyrrhizinilyticus]
MFSENRKKRRRRRKKAKKKSEGTRAECEQVMSKNVRRRGRRRRRTRRGNWFTRMKVWQKVLVCTAGVLICLVGSAAIYVAAQWSRIDRQEVRADDLVINQEVMEKNANIDLGEGYTNIALFGVDSRDGNLGEGNRTDMIIVASLNNETKEIRLVSVYRDTLLNLSEGTYQKCNAAYSYGGPTMAINMLNMNLDLDIEDYVTVDFGAISDMIDQLGGVEITIEEEELEAFNKYVTETARVAGKEAHKIDEPGTYLMDGSQATTYARIRSTAGGDFTRTERQRIVIEKAVEKIQKADLLTINNIISEVFPQISTSFTLQEILYYAQAYSQYKLLENTGFPFDQTTDTISGLGSIVIPQNLTDNVSQLHEFLFGDTDYTPSDTVSTISSTILATVDYSGSYDYSYSDYDDGSYSYDDGYEDSGGSGYDDTDDTSGTESSAEEY